MILQEMIAYLSQHYDSYSNLVLSHITLCLGCLGICFVMAVPLAYVCSRNRRIQTIVTPSLQTLRIIPSLAILLLLLPVLGTGTLPASIALIILGFPSVFMKAIDGFGSVSNSMLEYAKAMGMDKKEVFTKVHLPLAMPSILTGVKIASVELISSATIAAKIGAGGLGELIFTGLGLNRMDILILGASSVMILAFLMTVVCSLWEKRYKRYQ